MLNPGVLRERGQLKDCIRQAIRTHDTPHLQVPPISVLVSAPAVNLIPTIAAVRVNFSLI